MSTARWSAPAAPLTSEPVRLVYRLRPMGRTNLFRLHAARSADDRSLSEGELKLVLPKLHALDVAIARELRLGTIFGQLTDAQLARVMPLLAQRQTRIGNEPLCNEEEALEPRIAITRDGADRLCITMTLAAPNGERFELTKGRLLAGSQAFFLRGHRANPVASPAPWELTAWAAEPTLDLRGHLNADRRDELVSKLARAGVPPADLQVLAVQRGPPDRMVANLTAEGANRDLVVHLRLGAEYHGHRVAVGSASPSWPYIMASEGGVGLIERDLTAEDYARRALRRLRFRFDRGRDAFVAKGTVALSALDPGADIFPEAWLVERSAAPTFHRDLAIRTDIRLLADQGLIDLAVDIGALADDDEIVAALVEMKDLLSWLNSGHKYLRLNDGSYVAPSAGARQSLRILDDLGAESTRVVVSPLCIGLLRLFGDHNAIRAADEATRAWLDELSGTNEPARIPVPTEVAGVLREYQERGLDWLGMLHRHRLTGILADDMGLGKTVQTLALIKYVAETEGPKPSLVVAPTSVVTVWRDEAARFVPSLRIGLLHGSPQARRAVEVSDKDLLITSYGVLRRDAERLSAIPLRYVVLDEAQAAKNAATKNARAVRQLRSERRLALTGTPIENRPEELWATFDFLAPGFLGNLRRFRRRYARPIARGDEEALALLRARVQPLVLRRLKAEVAKELPPKIETTVRCQMDKAQRALYDLIAGRLRDSVLRKIERIGIERSHLDILAALTRLRQICCDPSLLPTPKDMKIPPSAKLELFAELMREALASERRVVVFSQFVQMQKRLIKVIKGLGVEPLWLHGGTRDRDKVVNAFQTPSGPPVIVVSLKAGGVGLTLTRADTVMHYDPWWNPAVERQATDRTHRLGQKQRVTVYKLICAETIEEKILALAARKDKLAEDLLGSEGGPAAKQITVDEVLALLQ